MNNLIGFPWGKTGRQFIVAADAIASIEPIDAPYWPVGEVAKRDEWDYSQWCLLRVKNNPKPYMILLRPDVAQALWVEACERCDK